MCSLSGMVQVQRMVAGTAVQQVENVTMHMGAYDHKFEHEVAFFTCSCTRDYAHVFVTPLDYRFLLIVF